MYREHKKLLFLGTFEEQEYLPHIKKMLGTMPCAVSLKSPTTAVEIDLICQKHGITGVISTNQDYLVKLCEQSTSSSLSGTPKISNYAGSLFQRKELEVVFVNPLQWIYTVPFGKFLLERYISKLTKPSKWFPTPKFSWKLYESGMDLEHWRNAYAIAIDIETFKDPVSIRCVGYTAIFISPTNEITTESLVIPCNSVYNLSIIRWLNLLPIRKIFQNGKYDIAYLQSYNAAPSHYLYDTAEMMHSWYVELPKDLAALNAFFVRNAMYWKDLADTNNLHDCYMYNALDTWATAMVFIVWMLEAPAFAKANYGNTFPLQFPCHLVEMTGIERDMEAMKDEATKQAAIDEKETASLCKMTGVNFNPGSSKQVLRLLQVLGCKDITSSEEKYLHKAATRHPLIGLFVSKILETRGVRKLLSTYLVEGKEFHGHLRQHSRGVILYSLNPHGTDTTRLASSEHHFWCGLQIQNIPRGIAVKRTLVSYDGFLIGECDLEQAESRDTAFIAGEKHLIESVTGDRDFHSLNASAIFVVPYDAIYSDELGKAVDKALRDLAKRVNHGANYNMGDETLVLTMGLIKIWEAKERLKLPGFWSEKKVANYLLEAFHRKYPGLRGIYYPGVVAEVRATSKITSKATHDVAYQAYPKNPLVRFCFSDPSKSKPALNAYVAHPPQSLNAQTLNRAWMRVFYEIALPNPKTFRLNAQIHDSILFQYAVGHRHLALQVKECMEIPVTVKSYAGATYTFTVPADLKVEPEDSPKTRNSWGDVA